jgi:hypothetical protein
MSAWERPGQSDEWYTPKYVFDALGVDFDLDVAAPPYATHVPAMMSFSNGALDREWHGFTWMNPPFGGRNGIAPWLAKFVEHGDGIALTPDRTSAPWFQHYARRMDAVLFVSPKIKFERPDGAVGKSPSTGTALLALGHAGAAALRRAAPTLGLLVIPQKEDVFA